MIKLPAHEGKRVRNRMHIGKAPELYVIYTLVRNFNTANNYSLEFRSIELR